MENDTSLKAVGERLRLVREARGFAHQGAFAKLLDVGQSRYANWEQGLHAIPYEFAIRVHSKTGATLDYLYRGDVSGLPSSLLQEISSRDPKKQASA